jgi:hypothetical protein
MEIVWLSAFSGQLSARKGGKEYDQRPNPLTGCANYVFSLIADGLTHTL